jgi:addiction module HigA family antidote
MASKKHHPHPGEILLEDILPSLQLSVSEAARQLGVSRVALSRVLNGRAAISVDLARRLERWLGGSKKGPSAESWLHQQMAYDLWIAEQTGEPDVQPVSSAA